MQLLHCMDCEILVSGLNPALSWLIQLVLRILRRFLNGFTLIFVDLVENPLQSGLNEIDECRGKGRDCPHVKCLAQLLVSHL